MNHVPRSDRAGRTAAVLAAIGFVGIAAFQVALAAGVAWGHAAWGGAHAELSTAQRAGSAVAIVVSAAAALIVLGRAGYFGRASHRLGTLLRRATWFLAAASALEAMMNFASQSRVENVVFGPLSLLLAILCTIVARSATDRVRGGIGNAASMRAR